MKPEDQRIAIAEACGYKLLPLPQNQNQKTWQMYGATVLLPDYLNDLNAMHEAEKILTKHNQAKYAEVLRTICCSPARTLSYVNDFWTIRATADQRCEAFLRTLNLWKDSK